MSIPLLFHIILIFHEISCNIRKAYILVLFMFIIYCICTILLDVLAEEKNIIIQMELKLDMDIEIDVSTFCKKTSPKNFLYQQVEKCTLIRWNELRFYN